MASPELAIAKAALSAALFRPDPSSLSRPEVEDWFQLLDATIAQCSRPNVQKCKNWTLNNVSSSPGRSSALAKFLAALSRSFSADEANPRPSLKRRRLHVLYILSDALHHTQANGSTLATACDATIPAIVASAASFDNCPKHVKKLQLLVELWQERQHFSPATVAKLRDTIASKGSNITANGDTATTATTDSSLPRIAKDIPYTIPASHGDATTPWYDLPAATWLPHLTPNSSEPMLPEFIKPLHLAAGPADDKLAEAVQKLLSVADRLYSASHNAADGPDEDIGQLGERIVVDEITGDVLSGDTYYGWSRQFCEQMKTRRRNPSDGKGMRQSRSRSRSMSRSRSVSRSRSRSRRCTSRSTSYSPSRKRRRYSESRSRSRSHSRSRSRSPPRRGASYSPSRSPTPERRFKRPRSHSRSRSPAPASFSRPPAQYEAPFPGSFTQPHNAHPPLPPPPPPAGYQGQWPPPPPPPNFPGGGPPPNWAPDPAIMNQMMAAWSAGGGGGSGGFPPPPPPPPPHGQGYGQNQHGHYQGQQRNHDGGGYRGRGRGGYNGGYRGR